MSIYFTCGIYGKERNVRGVLVRKREGKRPSGNSRFRWENIIRINPK